MNGTEIITYEAMKLTALTLITAVVWLTNILLLIIIFNFNENNKIFKMR